VLYWFRTPPGVKVGRAALDEDAIRLIEQLNPGIEFDWTRILKGQGGPATESRPPIEARRQRPDHRRPQSPHTPPVKPVQPPVPTAAPSVSLPAEFSSEDTTPAQVEELADPGPATEPSTDAPPRIEADVPTPAHARIGADGVQRLRARYAEILVRISERTADPARREELKAQADRLNPDAWVTDDEVVQGLEQYESVFASLREVVGQKRRRRRRGRGSRPAEPGAPVSATIDPADPSAGNSFDAPEGPDVRENVDGPEGPEKDDGPDDGGDVPPGET
jgi:hypothetical protein